MSQVKISGNASGTGTFTLAAPNSNTDRTLTLPDETGTVLTSASDITQNAGPAFSAYKATGVQTMSSVTWTKVALTLEQFDTNNCFDSSTNYRFTPTVAGYYQINATITSNYSTLKRMLGAIYKNGSVFLYYGDLDSTSAVGESFNTISGSTLVYMNGTTDYLELYAYLNGTIAGSSLGIYSNSYNQVQLSGYLARAA